ncbi:DMT family transporter [Desulfoplanes formicivorans]|uniref:Membrane protein n=1 Tax=Desulfoplanes formicivorans TaxID=1592317 RepID=A0A194AIP2_9BACT|nr:DMT family transporter [Desulfoplanes formicivorans]GAU09193.1 membrane protein [Desulfoplanes formicivorans]
MRIYLLLIGSVAIWGATWISGRILAQDIGPFSAAFLRFLAASVFLFLWSCRMNRRLPVCSRDHFPGLLLLGVSGVFCYNFFFFSGLQTVAAGRAALIIACIPVIICVASALIFKEPLTRKKIAGTLLSLTGVAIVLAKGNPLVLLQSPLSRGDLFILGCVASWTVYSLAGNRVMRHINPLEAVTWSCILGDILLLPFALYHGLVHDMANALPRDWGHVLFLGVIATGLAFTWYYQGIKAIGPSRAGIFINLVPVFAVLLGFAILKEPVSLALLGGGSLTLTGVWLTNR